MSKPRKTLDTILRGASDRNIRFSDLCGLLESLGFETRKKGSHHIFWREDVAEILNIQQLPDGKAKSYRVKQVRGIILKYQLRVPHDEI